MSGAVAAHAAYNGAGTQGLAVTNKINDTGDVMSVFWTKHDTTRQLLHGSSIVEVVSSGANGQSNTPGSSKIFTVNNDVDVLGDLFLELTLGVTLTNGGTPAATAQDKRVLMDYELDHNFQFKLIDRVEFMVGTQIWHTVTGNDIRVLTQTSKVESCSDLLSKQIACERCLIGDTDGVHRVSDASSLTQAPAPGTAETVRAVLWIPALSADLSAPLRKFYNITENGYFMAAAPQQSVKIKVTFSNGTLIGKFKEKTATLSAAGTAFAYPTPNSTPRTLGEGLVDGKGSIFDLKIPTDATVPADGDYGDYYPFKRVVLAHPAAPANATVFTDAITHSIELKIDRTRLFAKQIMLCKEERDQIRSVPSGLPYRIKMTQSIRAELPNGVEKTIDLDSFSLYASHLIISGDWVSANITFAELKLNSSSFSGNIPALILRNDMMESMHLFSGRTLVNPHVQRGLYTENLGRHERSALVFPLASTAFSGSSVPLNRFDSIRLTLTFSGTPVKPSSGPTKMVNYGITVTCVGETTILYKGGAATLAMY
jgi:hypothetical protein